MGHWESTLQREIHSITSLSQKHTKKIHKQEKVHINNQTSPLKELEEEQQTKPKVSRRKERLKIRAEINKIQSKKQQKRSMNP